MKTILQDIVASKKREVKIKKLKVPVKFFENDVSFPCISLKEILLQNESTGIIAEFKRKSPSRKNINDHSDIVQVTKGYVEAGVSGLSILTDSTFFGGSEEDLIKARVNKCPLLRKDFIIDEYQIIEAKYLGADTILLIAAILNPLEVYNFSVLAKQLGMEVLLEIHSATESDRINDLIDMVGINNRNLNDFSVSLETSLKLFDIIPDSIVKITESGIKRTEDILLLKQKGFKGFLMGEAFMQENQPDKACLKFIQELKNMEQLIVK